MKKIKFTRNQSELRSKRGQPEAKIFFLIIVLAGAVLFSACTASKNDTSAPTTPATGGTGIGVGTGAEQKQGDTTKTGVVSEAGGKYFLTETGQTPLQISSYAVDLSTLVGKTVTVTGQYSGDELFVGKVE